MPIVAIMVVVLIVVAAIIALLKTFPPARRFADPRVRWGARWHHYAFLLALALVGAFTVVETGVSVDNAAQQYAKRFRAYQVNQPVPPKAPAALPVTYTRPTADSGHVTWAYMPDVQNQGSLGSCQCWAFNLQYSYLYNAIHHLTGTQRDIFSCRLWYNLVTQGVDSGSYFDQYPSALSSVGGVYRSQYDWSGWPQGTTYPLPANIVQEAAAHRYRVTSEVISAGGGGGDQSLFGIEHALSRHLAVNLDLPVFSGSGSFYDPSGLIDSSHTGYEVGGHAITIVGYDRNLVHNGVKGWFLIQNQWTTTWGLTRDGTPRTGDNGGFALVSYREVAAEGFGIEVMHLTKIVPQTQKPPTWAQPGPALSKPLPFAKSGLKAPAPRAPQAVGDWVYGDFARDVCSNGYWSTSCARYADMGRVVNAAAHYYGISAPGLLATLFTECGAYTHSYQCDRYGYGADVSFGRCQVTVQTAAGFGIGGYNDEAVRQYENNYANCIWLAARVLGSYKGYLERVGCYVDFPNLYVAWNAGPGNPCYFILNPTGQAGANYYGDCGACGFLYYWRVALGYSRPYDPYAVVFPRAAWGRVNPYYNGSLSWAASIWLNTRWLGRALGRGHWYGDYTKTPFQRGAIFTWPRTHRFKVTRSR